MAVDLAHPGANPTCPRCGGSGLLVVPLGEHARSRQCDCVQVCPHCRDTGLVDGLPDTDRQRLRQLLRRQSTNHERGALFRLNPAEEEELAELRDRDRTAVRTRCACHEVKRRWALLDGATLPARHADSTRATFVPKDKVQTAVVGALTKYVQSFRAPSSTHETRGLLLWGEVGRGKTHLLVALVRELVLEHGISARFVEFSHLVADLKSGFETGRGMGELLDPLVRVDLLAIDELGKGRNTEFEGTVIDELVSRRYNAMRPILATTNFSPNPATGKKVANAAEAALARDGDPSPLLPTLPDRLGERVWSRLAETCTMVEVKGEDHRLRRRAAAAGARAG